MWKPLQSNNQAAPPSVLVLGVDMVPHVESRYEWSIESEFTARNDSALFELTLKWDVN